MQQIRRQTAVNEIIKTAKKIKNIYENASKEKLDRDISALCMDMARKHEKVIKALDQEILGLGDLPREPNLDRQVFEEGLTHIRAQLAENTEYTLLEELQGYEKRLAEDVSRAIELDLPESTKKTIDSLKEVISDSFKRLSEAKLKQI